MDYSAIAWANFCCLNPAVFGEVRWDAKVLIVNHTFCRNVELHRHGQHDVRFAYLPAVSEARSGGQFLRVTFRCALINPGHDCVDLLLREPSLVRELSVRRICVPRRHRPVENFLFDGSRPRTRVFVVSSDIGAASPARWQVTQLLKKICATSFENVTARERAPLSASLVRSDSKIAITPSAIKNTRFRECL